MEDIQAGCEAVVEALKGWTQALAQRDFSYLERVLSADFQFTCDPEVGGGRMTKDKFIDMDRHIHNSDIQFIGLTARRVDNLVTVLSFAKVCEEFKGDLGPGMPTAEEMNKRVGGNTLAYASAWREHADGTWQCFSHHIFGEIAQ